MEAIPHTRAGMLAAQLKEAIADPPCFSAGLPGIGGLLKAMPEHFQVEEILPYTPCGEGEHVYVTVRRSGWNTADVAAALGKRLHLKQRDIGWGGRKDRQAVTTQTFSFCLPMTVPIEKVEDDLNGSPFEILAVQRHRNKIKTGHVAGNRFSILLSQVSPQALEPARNIARILLQHGVPNFYGEQRFGHQLRNLDSAANMLGCDRPVQGRPKGRNDTFMISALQSALFNAWLKKRIERGDANRILAGDLVQKCDTGGLFNVDDADEVQSRLQQHAVVYTGPIFGHKMMAAQSTAAQYESEILEFFDLDPQVFKPLRAAGSRRAGLLFIDDLHISPEEDGMRFCFTLPSGAYATTVMREFMRPPC